MGTTHKLIRTYDAVPAAVPFARHALTGFAADAGASPDELDAIRLASSEALTNVVVHAYGDEPGLLQVSAAITEDELWILVTDDGNGLHPGTSQGGLGVGLALIAELTDGFAIVTRSTGGIEVQMRFTLARLRAARCNGRQVVRSSAASATTPAASVFSTTR